MFFIVFSVATTSLLIKKLHLKKNMKLYHNDIIFVILQNCLNDEIMQLNDLKAIGKMDT